MSTWADRIGVSAHADLGDGYSIPPEAVIKDEDIVYSAFNSLDTSDAEDDVPEINASLLVDMEVSRKDRIIRAPGILVVEDATPRNLRWVFEHSSVDYSTELVAIDPPWLGYKGTGAFNWLNLAIAATGSFGWVGISVAGTLIFSNGRDHTYTRNPAALVVTDISAQVIARTFATVFGRVFAGAPSPGGNLQTAMVAWNAANGNPADWTGLGSGAELLLSDMREADKLVSLRAIGFDMLGIVNRKSLWVGYPTSNPSRPADFRQRIPGIGGVADWCTTAVPGGVAFLGDEGVFIFDSNEVRMISKEINGDLLPLDYGNIQRYVLKYQPIQQRLILVTPVGVYVYEMPRPGHNGRWWLRSALVDNVIVFTAQYAGQTWDAMPGTWDGTVGSWNDYIQQTQDVPTQVHYTKDTRLGREDRSSFYNFVNQQLAPVWRTKLKNGRETEMIITKGFYVKYKAIGGATLTLRIPDEQGNFIVAGTRVLPDTGNKTVTKFVDGRGIGLGAQVQIEIGSGDPEILRIRQIVEDGGVTPSLTSI